MKRIKAVLILLFCTIGYLAAAQSRDTTFMESPVKVVTETGELAGTLTMSDRGPGGPVALIIAGSGPTDRNGNSIFTQNNCLQMIARDLANMGIASVRYDKRGIGQSAKAMKREVDLRFDDYINDAIAWVEFLKKDERFKSVTVIGHSEGSLIGMVAALKAGADKYVSIAGTGRPIDEILKEQLKGSEEMTNLATPVLDSLKQGLHVKVIDRKLMTLFRPSVQPFMISWLKYDPRIEIKKLKIPVLLVQGTTDLQVTTENAKLLNAALPSAELVVFQGMNHVLKLADADPKANEATYHEPMRPLAPGLTEAIAKFIQKK